MSAGVNNKPYQGSEPYIFISYSHKDIDEAMTIINQLCRNQFRIWYDEGIDPGTEWDENIASHVEQCNYFVALVSNNYLASSNCKDELNYARELDKPRLLVYLENVDLPGGMKMRLSRLQAIHKYTYTDSSLFFTKLYEAKDILKCRGETGKARNDHEQECCRHRHLIFVIDSSGSMMGKRITGINKGLERFSSFLEAENRGDSDLAVEVILYNSGVTVCSLEHFEPAVAEGSTNFGMALEVLRGFGKNLPKDNKCALVFTLDGWPTDSYKEITDMLAEEVWFASAYKRGIAIGEDVDVEALRSVVNDMETIITIYDRDINKLSDIVYSSALNALESIANE